MKKLALVIPFMILASGCVQDPGLMPEPPLNFSACQTFSAEDCPDYCVVCPPCEVCSSISCQSEDFCLGLGFDRDWHSRVSQPPLNETTGITEQRIFFDDPPTLYGIGIDLEPWDSETNMAGDVSFGGLQYDDRVFIEFGGDMGGSPNVHPTFVLPLGTGVRAVSDGTVYRIETLGDDDYDVCVHRGQGDPWCVSYEHVSNPVVSEGDTVRTGDIIGEAGRINEFTDSGKFDLKVWEGGATILNHCPYDLLDPSVREEKQDEISRFIQDWEAFLGKDVYQEEDWLSPGCGFETLTEG